MGGRDSAKRADVGGPELFPDTEGGGSQEGLVATTVEVSSKITTTKSNGDDETRLKKKKITTKKQSHNIKKRDSTTNGNKRTSTTRSSLADEKSREKQRRMRRQQKNKNANNIYKGTDDGPEFADGDIDEIRNHHTSGVSSAEYDQDEEAEDRMVTSPPPKPYRASKSGARLEKNAGMTATPGAVSVAPTGAGRAGINEIDNLDSSFTTTTFGSSFTTITSHSSSAAAAARSSTSSDSEIKTTTFRQRRLDGTNQQAAQDQGNMGSAPSKENHRQARLRRDEGLGEAAYDEEHGDSDQEEIRPGIVRVDGYETGRRSNFVDVEYDNSTQVVTVDPSTRDTAATTVLTEEDEGMSGLAKAQLVVADEENPEEDGNVVISEAVEDPNLYKGTFSWIKRHRRASIIIAVLFVAIVVTSSVLATSDLVGSSPSLAQETFDAASERFRDAYFVIEPSTSGDIDDASPLLNPPSTQYDALVWLADEDGLGMDFTTTNRDVVVQRFALATLYLAMGGTEWNSNYTFLSADSECGWSGINEADNSVAGVECNDEGLVQRLSLQNNGLNGTMPNEVGSFPSLESFNVASNPLLSGTIPASLFAGTNLTSVNLQGSAEGGGLTGVIPETIGQATELRSIVFDENSLVGTIPSSIGQLVKLESLSLEGNLLSGSIPSDIGNLTSMTTFMGSSNAFTGRLPAEMDQLTNLQVLNLEFNALVGGAQELCTPLVTNGQLRSYVVDCLEQSVPAIVQELPCSCCTLCCSEQLNSVGGTTSGDSSNCIPN